MPDGPVPGDQAPLDEQSSGQSAFALIRHALDVAGDQPTAVLAAAFSVMSALLFGAQWIYLERFWGVFGLRPEEVGVDQVAMVTRGVVATLIGIVVLLLVPCFGYAFVMAPVMVLRRTPYLLRYIEWIQRPAVVRASMLGSYLVAAGVLVHSSLAWESVGSDLVELPRSAVSELGVFIGLAALGVLVMVAGLVGNYLCREATWGAFVGWLVVGLCLVVAFVVLFGSKHSAESLQDDPRPMNRSIFGISILDIRAASLELSREQDCGFLLGDHAGRYIFLADDDAVAFFPVDQTVVRLDPDTC